MNHYLESLFSLKGKIAVVTGGGRGLGKGMAMGLAGAGAEVALVSRTEKELKETIEEIRARRAGKPEPIPLMYRNSIRFPPSCSPFIKIKGGLTFW